MGRTALSWAKLGRDPGHSMARETAGRPLKNSGRPAVRGAVTQAAGAGRAACPTEPPKAACAPRFGGSRRTRGAVLGPKKRRHP